MKVTLGQLALAGALGALGTFVWWSQPVPTTPERIPSSHEQEVARQVLAVVAEMLAARECFDASCDPVDPAFARRVATEGRRQLTAPDRSFRDDCSGFVSAVFTANDVPMDGVVSSLYDLAAVHGTIHWSETPRIGDLVFFDDTHDRNHNGRWDDTLTHIGLVVDVEPDGTAVYAHAGTSKGRSLGRINVRQPKRYKDAEGRVLNSYLREPDRGDPLIAGYLSGSLWVGFATVRPELDWRTPPPPPEGDSW